MNINLYVLMATCTTLVMVIVLLGIKIYIMNKKSYWKCIAYENRISALKARSIDYVKLYMSARSLNSAVIVNIASKRRDILDEYKFVGGALSYDADAEAETKDIIDASYTRPNGKPVCINDDLIISIRNDVRYDIESIRILNANWTDITEETLKCGQINHLWPERGYVLFRKGTLTKKFSGYIILKYGRNINVK